LAEQRFHDIAEAYECLSDRGSRSHYDNLLQKKFDLEDAEKTFTSFFDEHGIVDPMEEEFFNKNYPKRE
jgi:DnaJ-class molecular chaperone